MSLHRKSTLPEMEIRRLLRTTALGALQPGPSTTVGVVRSRPSLPFPSRSSLMSVLRNVHGSVCCRAAYGGHTDQTPLRMHVMLLLPCYPPNRACGTIFLDPHVSLVAASEHIVLLHGVLAAPCLRNAAVPSHCRRTARCFAGTPKLVKEKSCAEAFAWPLASPNLVVYARRLWSTLGEYSAN